MEAMMPLLVYVQAPVTGFIKADYFALEEMIARDNLVFPGGVCVLDR